MRGGAEALRIPLPRGLTVASKCLMVTRPPRRYALHHIRPAGMWSDLAGFQYFSAGKCAVAQSANRKKVEGDLPKRALKLREKVRGSA